MTEIYILLRSIGCGALIGYILAQIFIKNRFKKEKESDKAPEKTPLVSKSVNQSGKLSTELHPDFEIKLHHIVANVLSSTETDVCVMVICDYTGSTIVLGASRDEFREHSSLMCRTISEALDHINE